MHNLKWLEALTIDLEMVAFIKFVDNGLMVFIQKLITIVFG